MIRKSITFGTPIPVLQLEYHRYGQKDRGEKDRVMSRSDLVKFAKCPRKWLRGEPEEEADSLEFGALLDCLALTPDRYEASYAVCPEVYPSRGMQCPSCGSVTDSASCKKCKKERVEITVEKEWIWSADYCAKWRTDREAEGRACVKADVASEAWKAVARLWQDSLIESFVKASARQTMVCVDWHDPETGIVVPIKCLLDLVPDRKSDFGTMLGDLKTARNASKGAWGRVVDAEGYDVQAALYMDAWNAATGENRDTFAHIIVENQPPYETARRILSDEFINKGRGQYQNALMDYCQCLKSGDFPGYDDHPRNRTLDGWTVIEPELWQLTKSEL